MRFTHLLCLVSLLSVPCLGSKFASLKLQCAVSYRMLAQARSQQPGFETLLATQLHQGLEVIDSALGLIKIVHYDAETGQLTYTRPGIALRSKVPRPTDAVFAHPASQAGRQMTEARLHARFSRAENIPGFLLSSMLRARVSLMREDHPLTIRYRQWATEAGWENFPAYGEKAAMGRFAHLVKERTGEDLIRTTVLFLFERDKVRKEAWPMQESGVRVDRMDDANRSSGSAYSPILGGTITDLPLDIDFHVRYDLWSKGVDAFEGASTRKEPVVLLNYLPQNRPGREADPISVGIDAFKETGQLGELEGPFKQALAPALEKLLQGVDKENVVIVPVPSGSGNPAAPTSVLAQAVAQVSGTLFDGKTLALNAQHKADKQQFQKTLWDRMGNVSPANYRLKGNWEGKTVIFVDDISTSGATEANVRQTGLVKGKAARVEFIHLAGSR